MILVFDCAKRLSTVLLIGSVLAFSNVAKTAEVNPLRPVDTASPRETLQDFVVTMDGIYSGLKGILQEYAASGRLYLTSDERRRQVEVLSAAAKAIRVLDLSDIPPVLQQTVAAERGIQLKEILDRIELPSFKSVPDRNAATGLPSKRWRLPETEIEIALVENGQHALLWSSVSGPPLPCSPIKSDWRARSSPDSWATSHGISTNSSNEVDSAGLVSLMTVIASSRRQSRRKR
jgi:hypothetical protein